MREMIENIGSAMSLCEYVMLNGKETSWGCVYETLTDYTLEDVAVENIPETKEEEFCYVSIRETLINIVNIFRLGGGYNYTDSGVLTLVRLFTKLYEQLLDILGPDDIIDPVPDDIEEDDDMMF